MNVYTSEVEMLRAQCKEWEKVCNQHLRHIKKLKKERAWVGLTDEEREFLLHQALRFYDTNAQLLSFIKTVETKLREKNT